MEISYIRDLEHNYMIVKPEGEAPAYTLKMLERQPANSLIPFEMRSINAEPYLYYRIDAMQSLENRCLARKLDMETLCALFEALRCAERELGEYLLGIDSLYLTPETVFLERDGGCFRFACMPFAQMPDGNLAAFTEALLPLVDPDDREAAEAAYRLCACASETGTRLRDLAVREADVAYTDTVADRGYDADAGYYGGPMRADTVQSPKGTEAYPEAGVWYDTEPWEEAAASHKPSAGPKKRVNMRVMGLLFTVVLLADIYIRKEYVLTAMGNVLSLAVIGISVCCIAGAFFLSRRGKGKADAPDGLDHAAENEAGVAASAVHYSGLWDDLYEAEGPVREGGAERIPEACAPAWETYRQPEEEDARTVLLAPKKKRTRTAKLYGRDNDHNCHVPLEHLPLTLGKLKGHVDFLLRDESVSRIHAHISRNPEGQVCVRDLNSTNGTFLNGVRLSPNETVHIREGDEICFGDMVFEYL